MKNRFTTYVTRMLVASAFVLLSLLNYGQQISSVPDCTNPPAIQLGTANPVCLEEGWIYLPYSNLSNFNISNGNLIIVWDSDELTEFDYNGPAADLLVTIWGIGPVITIRIPDVAPGTYTGTIILTNAEGCSSVPYPFTATIKEPLTAPEVVSEVVNGEVVDGIIQICGEGSITVTATGEEGAEYRWYDKGIIIHTGQVFDYTFYTPMYDSDTYTYEVSQSLSNQNCESARTTISVTHSRIPYPGGFNPDNKICVGSTKQVEIWAQPDAGGTWGSSNTNVATVDQTGLVTGVGAGSANITYSLTGTGACASTTSSSSVPFQVYDNYAEITGNNSPVSAGGTAEFYIDAPVGRSLYYTINDGEQKFYLTEESSVIRVENIQENVKLELISVACNIYCTKYLTGEPGSTSTVTVSSPPVVSIESAISAIDEGGTVTLTASGADTYIWDYQSSTESSIEVSPLLNTTYSVTGSVSGVSATAYATVIVRESCKNSADQYEPNNSMAEVVFTVPVGIKIAANLLNSKDADWYGLYIDTNAKYTLSLQNTNGTNLPTAALYNAAGRSLKSIDRANPNSYNLSTGWYYIKVSAKGLKSYLCYTLEVVNDAPVTGFYASEDEDLLKSAIIEPTEDGICKIWPNPALKEFSLFNGFKSPIQVRISDIMGRTIETIDKVGAEQTIVFGTGYKPGIYFVEILADESRQIIKVIKQQ